MRKTTKSKVVRKDIDLNNLPPLTGKQIAELKALAARPDSEINCSDIPPLTDDFFAHAVRNPLYKPTKTPSSVRIDTDVLVWLKSQGKGWQKRMNAALRETMLREFKQRKTA